MTKMKSLLLVFLVMALVLQGSMMVAAEGPGQDDAVSDQPGEIGAQDQIINDDLIVDGSLCVGFDCVNGENFSFDTIILKENNLRIYFNDTSNSASFPYNDWRITVNDTASGGRSYFSIDDVTGGTRPFTILAGGNVGIGTDTPSEKLHVAGNVLVNGSVTETSDVNAKENFELVAGGAVLDQLAEIPITTWNYKADDSSVRHMGPMAQDFYAAFGLGQDDLHIAPLDTNGVALAAIQELHQMVQEKDAQIVELQQQNVELEARLSALEELVARMQQK